MNTANQNRDIAYFCTNSCRFHSFSFLNLSVFLIMLANLVQNNERNNIYHPFFAVRNNEW